MNNVEEKHVGSIYIRTDGDIVSIVCTGCDGVVQVMKGDIKDSKKMIPHVKCPICFANIQLCAKARRELMKV